MAAGENEGRSELATLAGTTNAAVRLLIIALAPLVNDTHGKGYDADSERAPE